MIRGKQVADSITQELTRKVKMIKFKGLVPKLVVVRVGSNESDRAYETGALKRCEAIGIAAEVKVLSSGISEEDFVNEIISLNEDDSVNGILILRPLPKHINEDKVKHVIAKEKDVDCFNPLNVANVMENDKKGFAPCTSAAVIEILKHYNVPIAGKSAAVLGSSMVVGKPVSMMLVNENSTLTLCDINTKDNPEACSKADIVVVAIGKSKLIGSEYIKDGAVVIDVGINVDEEGNITGDVDLDQVKDKVSMISPVPGGVGSVTTSILAMHVVKACYQQNGMMYF
jgi:methylenetetrahydrofolate dehydrogenase (NADP+)/methenyltetrahydrofolate cyclohydrolase